MCRRLNFVWLLLAFFLASEAVALGLGDIRLDSALNEPMRADIELISATPEELESLEIQVATAETFDRYGIDRPAFLANLRFEIIESGRTDGNIVRVTSLAPITEPFLTFLIEAVWSRGRLLREYTVLLDPPTFAREPATQPPPTVTAPTRRAPADSGRIETPAPAPAPETRPTVSTRRAEAPVTTSPVAEPEAPPAPAEPIEEPAPRPEPAPERVAAFDDTPAGDYYVNRGDTLWGIATRFRPDSRLTINQTMLAIYEANPEAFAGNINILSAGATLRMPSADDIFGISRADALVEVQRQHAAWQGAPSVAADTGQPSLTLVPPDEDALSTDSPAVYDADDLAEPAVAPADADEARIREIEQLLADQQDALIEISDNELAALRAELARLRGEELPPEPVAAEAEEAAAEEVAPATDEAEEVLADDAEEPAPAEPVEAQAEEQPADAAPVAARDEGPRVLSTRGGDSLLDTILGWLTSFWALIGVALLIVFGVLLWFARRAARSGDEEESTGVWEALDEGSVGEESRASTERLGALAKDEESIVVVEQDAGRAERLSRTSSFESPAMDEQAQATLGDDEIGASLDDTFSSETAINLDQSDPVAEADFHMAYGLYDQAADLINGALEVEPGRRDLLAKLSEIYFVWGNRDSFVDAAMRLKDAIGGEEDPEWDKTVIMGRQIAGDHELFSDEAAAGATKAVDLDFEGDLTETGALDMNLADEQQLGGESEVFDFGAEPESGAGDDDGLDFSFDDSADTGASATREMPTAGGDDLEALFEETAFDDDSSTQESPTLEMPPPDDDATAETPTIEEQFGMTETLSSLSDADATELAGLDDGELASDATAEIDLDDLGLDLAGLEDSGEDDGGETYELSDLDDTSESNILQMDDELEATGRNELLSEEDDASATTGTREAFDFDDALAETTDMPSIEEPTGTNEALQPDEEDTDVELDTSLLDATGQTQILPEDFTVETGTGTNIEKALSDDESTLLASDYGDEEAGFDEEPETLLAPMDDDDEAGDFDFAKTEALPKDAFDTTPDDLAAAGSTDMDLDLDELTAALDVSAAETVNQVRDDATVEQPRPTARPAADDDSPTEAISPDDLSGDLHDARTMTEVGTKLDLARAYVDMGDPAGARSILEEVLDEGDDSQRQQARQLLESLPG